MYYAYKFVLTLSCTRVTSCERIFSKLNNVKIKLRSTISQKTTEALNIKRNLEIDKESLIDTIEESSNELSKLLF